MGVWVVDDDQKDLNKFFCNGNIGANFNSIVFCDDALGYVAHTKVLEHYQKISELNQTSYLLTHWNIKETNAESTRYELCLDYCVTIPTETFCINVISDNTLIIEKSDGSKKQFSKHKNYTSTLDFRVQSMLIPGCWIHSSGIKNGVTVYDDFGYVFCKDGSGYTFENSKPEVKVAYFNWRLVWDKRDAYFQEIKINSTPVQNGFYLDISLDNGISHKFLCQDLFHCRMRCHQHGLFYKPYECLCRDYSYIAPLSSSGSITKVDDNNDDPQGGNEKEDDPSKLTDSDISAKLIGKWIYDKTTTSAYSSYYVFLDNGAGYWESLDSYSGACERNWLHWSVKNGVLSITTDGIGSKTYEIKFDETKLKLITNNTESIYTYSSVYLKYPYGEPPYNGYYIHDKYMYANKYYPIYSAEEKKDYAAGGETYNHMYLIFKGKNNNDNTWASLDYATPRWDGLPSGWKEGKYYISTNNSAYSYSAAFKIDGQRISSTNSDYLEITKEGNCYSYKYYGTNVDINFTGTIK